MFKHGNWVREILEGIQRRERRNNNNNNNNNFLKNWKKIGLTTFIGRRMKGDFIEIFKIKELWWQRF